MPMPKTEIDFKELDALLQFRVTCEFVADYLGVSRDTVIRRIREEKDMTFREYHLLKMQRTATKLQQKAIEQALSGNSNSVMIFALKNLAGWTDKNEVENVTKLEIKIDKDDEGL